MSGMSDGGGDSSSFNRPQGLTVQDDEFIIVAEYFYFLL